MEWLKELLKKAGIEDAKIDGLVGDINKEIPKYLIPKDKYNDLATAKTKLETDLGERDKQLETLSKTAGASEELKKEITQLQTANTAAAEKHASELKALTLTNAIKSALNGKVHDESLVAGLFDKEKLVIDGDKVVGLDDQLKGLQESKAFLFKTESAGSGGGSGFKVGGSGGSGGGAATNEQLANIFGVAAQK
ncbi:hypothetical protein KCTCHS21_17590 [Cohnella abietis]|uniref:Minor structural GP20 protein n=2 Tax=Cohnella abietis TaxID=2507935 RepID=A0A3T1D2M8_9BACL|nr:hypothetical protein KCTCHS21_17590 [Cohnella abietis]